MRANIPLLTLALVGCMTFTFVTDVAAVRPPSVPTPATFTAQQPAKSCQTELAEDVPEVSFAAARRYFGGRGLRLRAATLVERANDLAGSILLFGGRADGSTSGTPN